MAESLWEKMKSGVVDYADDVVDEAGDRAEDMRDAILKNMKATGQNITEQTLAQIDDFAKTAGQVVDDTKGMVGERIDAGTELFGDSVERSLNAVKSGNPIKMADGAARNLHGIMNYAGESARAVAGQAADNVGSAVNLGIRGAGRGQDIIGDANEGAVDTAVDTVKGAGGMAKTLIGEGETKPKDTADPAPAPTSDPTPKKEESEEEEEAKEATSEDALASQFEVTHGGAFDPNSKVDRAKMETIKALMDDPANAGKSPNALALQIYRMG